MSARTHALLEKTTIKAQQASNVIVDKEARGTRPGVKMGLDLERGRLLTESYRQTEGEPMQLRRAKALAHILDNMTIYIRDGELIVGNFASTPDSVAIYPELQIRWIVRETEPGKIYGELLSGDEREELKEIASYWDKRAVHSLYRKYVPKELSNLAFTFGYEWATPNYEKLFRVGLNGIIQEVMERKERLVKEYLAENFNGIEYVNKCDFLESALITLEAVIRWEKRYAVLAREKAETEKDTVRKEELEAIASNCEWIAGNPPRTLYEALQLFWLIYLVTHFIDMPMVGCGIRFDKCFGSFYENDLKEGRITRDQAQELVECLFVQDQGTGFLHAPIWSGFGGGATGYHTINIGGTDSQGKDITNEMSYIVLDAMKNVKTMPPPLALRYHDGTPQELINSAIDLLASGVPHPAFFNDKVNIPRMLNLGVPLEDAREYSISNCMLPTVPGKNLNHPGEPGLMLPVPQCLDAALGIDPLPGWLKKVGDKLPAPENLNSVEELIDATMENLKWLIHQLVLVGNIGDAIYRRYTQRPLFSALLDDCIERAQDVREWNCTPEFRELPVAGLNNAANSLAAIKKLVFEEKKFSMATLIEALKHNWEGYEDIRQMCLAAPKFGNDDDYVDLISRDLAVRIVQATSGCRSNMDDPFIIDGTSATIHWMLGATCPATPDGRTEGEPFHDGTISPMGGTDKKGPTAVLNSVAKVDPLLTWNHLFNQSFMPIHLKDHNSEIFAQYLKTWADMGIYHIQFTTVDKETLLDAQKHPEKYPSLLVRVCGFAAYFVDLGKNVQDQIISRCTQSFA